MQDINELNNLLIKLQNDKETSIQELNSLLNIEINENIGIYSFIKDIILLLNSKRTPKINEARIYFDDTDPAEEFGGTWEKIVDRFLIGAGGKYTLGATGGSEDAVLVLHGRHLYYQEDWVGAGKGNNNRYLEVGTLNAAGSINRGWLQGYGNEMYPAGQELGEDGTGKNMPPFIAVNIWKRIA